MAPKSVPFGPLQFQSPWYRPKIHPYLDTLAIPNLSPIKVLNPFTRMKKSAGGKRRPLAKASGTPKTIDEYLAHVPEPARSTLRKVRAAIRSAAPPQATETISYGIPAFRYKGTLVWFAAFSDHCSFFPTS